MRILRMHWVLALLLRTLFACGGDDSVADTGVGMDSSVEDGGVDGGADGCEPITCDGLCGGSFDDGCGGTLECPPCECTPDTCESLARRCGDYPDGCGGTLDCGLCGPCDDEPSCWTPLPDGVTWLRSVQCGVVVSSCDDTWTDDCGECGDREGTCVDHACVCDNDDYEPNDTMATATDLGEFVDDANICLWRQGVLADDSDVDWYTFHVEDTFSLGNPNVAIRLSGGADWGMWYLCDSADDGTECGPGMYFEDDTTYGPGCTGGGITYLSTECEGTDDSGTIIIRVEREDHPSGSIFGCEQYELRLRISDGGNAGCLLSSGDEDFECSNGSTVPLRLVCDGNDDCGDNSDETEYCG
jgi:hypothetical protein